MEAMESHADENNDKTDETDGSIKCVIGWVDLRSRVGSWSKRKRHDGQLSTARWPDQKQ